MKSLASVVVSLALVIASADTSSAQALAAPAAEAGPPTSDGPTRPARQTSFHVRVDGVSAVQLAWWFQHIADDDGAYWKALAPRSNRAIRWIVNPREDAHQIIGAMFVTEQASPALARLQMRMQFQDYVTQPRGWSPGAVTPLNPTLNLPRDYTPPYPSPLLGPRGGPLDAASSAQNGFNEQLIVSDGAGFAPARMFWSWRNVGGDDTAATSGEPPAVEVTMTLYEPWMERANRPPAQAHDGYAYSAEDVAAIWAPWKVMLEALPAHLPRWFGVDTQDDLARAKGFTVTGLIDTGVVDGVDSKMMIWWWNHAMGDAPGDAYSLWCPPAHYAIRWLPGFSPAEVLGSRDVPTDRVVPGAIYPDLQGGHLEQDGGGMMSYPVAMSPVPGRYKTLDPMIPVSKAQVDGFARDRFPVPDHWLLHQWEDREGGLIHRSTLMDRLPLHAPITQQGFYAEHQLMEGQFWGTSGMRKAYAAWRAGQPIRRADAKTSGSDPGG